MAPLSQHLLLPAEVVSGEASFSGFPERTPGSVRKASPGSFSAAGMFFSESQKGGEPGLGAVADKDRSHRLANQRTNTESLTSCFKLRVDDSKPF